MIRTRNNGWTVDCAVAFLFYLVKNAVPRAILAKTPAFHPIWQKNNTYRQTFCGVRSRPD